MYQNTEVQPETGAVENQEKASLETSQKEVTWEGEDREVASQNNTSQEEAIQRERDQDDNIHEGAEVTAPALAPDQA